MLYMVTFTINIPPMLAYIPYMDPMGYGLMRGQAPHFVMLLYKLNLVNSIWVWVKTLVPPNMVI